MTLLSPVAYTAFAAQVAGYVLLSTALQLFFYKARSHDSGGWRCQPAVTPHAPDGGSRWRWGLPALDLSRSRRSASRGAGSGKEERAVQTPRHPWHAVFATVNLLVSASCAAAVAEATARGASTVTRECGEVGCAASVVRGLFLSLLLQSALEYPWHALMHTPCCYRAFHRHHHYYKSPQV
jgi:hypothetical protein